MIEKTSPDWHWRIPDGARRFITPSLHGNNDPSDNNSTEDDVGAVATLFGWRRKKAGATIRKNGGREERDEGRTSACSLGKGRRWEKVTRALEVCSLEERLAEDRALTITSIDRRARKIFGARTSSGVIGSTVDWGTKQNSSTKTGKNE